VDRADLLTSSCQALLAIDPAQLSLQPMRVCFVGEEQVIDLLGARKEWAFQLSQAIMRQHFYFRDAAAAATATAVPPLSPSPSRSGLFYPHTTAPLSVLEALGRLFARALLEPALLLAAPLPVPYIKAAMAAPLLPRDAATLDPDLFHQIASVAALPSELRIQDVLPGLSFAVPSAGNPSSEAPLRQGWARRLVVEDNFDEFARLVVSHILLSDRFGPGIAAFSRGLTAVVPLHELQLFCPAELQAACVGSPLLTHQDVLANIVRPTSHGPTEDADVAAERDQRLWDQFEAAVLQLSADELSSLVQFVTGSPVVPYEGMGALSPPLSLARIRPAFGTDTDDLCLRVPSASTCFNSLRIPLYPDTETMVAKLRLALTQTVGFQLS
jgi:hypothetical protein